MAPGLTENEIETVGAFAVAGLAERGTDVDTPFELFVSVEAE